MAQILRRRGRVQLRLNAEEREALLGIVAVLRPHVAATSAAAPRAYADDPEADSDYAKWVHPDLTKGRDADLDSVVAALDSGDDTLVLTEPAAFAWLRGLTHLRLAAGTAIGIEGDNWELSTPPEKQATAEFRMLVTLGWLQEELVAALES